MTFPPRSPRKIQDGDQTDMFGSLLPEFLPQSKPAETARPASASASSKRKYAAGTEAARTEKLAHASQVKTSTVPTGLALADELAAFCAFGLETRRLTTDVSLPGGQTLSVPAYVNEFWTAKQRAAHGLHEISYRACFKPQLPRFFIERLTAPGDVVYDPFMGRGTTLLEAALMERVPYGCDINPLSLVLAGPRLRPPDIGAVAARLDEIDFRNTDDMPDELLVFYHPETLREIGALRKYLLARAEAGTRDFVDDWIACVALNRLTGHSPGFFSVYTMPPNQAVSVKSQLRINTRRNQTPPRRMVAKILLKKTASLLSDCDVATRRRLASVADRALLLNHPASTTPEIADGAVSLVVTSPPFLNVVDYATDNWLRCWFLGIDAKSVKLTLPRRVDDWQAAMTEVFHELSRVLKPGGHVAFEVGEVHCGKTRLEEAVLPCGVSVGLKPLLVLVNDQEFTKTANCWGVDNNAKGTNTNRIVLFTKAG